MFENQYEKAEAGEALSGRRRNDWVQFLLYGVQQVRDGSHGTLTLGLTINLKLDDHHIIEESTIFPLLEEKGVKMEQNVEQHAAFAPAMIELINYLRSCLDSADHKIEYTAAKHKVRFAVPFSLSALTPFLFARSSSTHSSGQLCIISTRRSIPLIQQELRRLTRTKRASKWRPRWVLRPRHSRAKLILPSSGPQGDASFLRCLCRPPDDLRPSSESRVPAFPSAFFLSQAAADTDACRSQFAMEKVSQSRSLVQPRLMCYRLSCPTSSTGSIAPFGDSVPKRSRRGEDLGRALECTFVLSSRSLTTALIARVRKAPSVHQS